MNITVGLFTERLEALCRSLDVQLHITDGDDGPYLYLMRSAEGAGSSYVDIDDEIREPPAPYVPPPPTPEELARSAERESLAAASRETWLAGFSPTGPLEPAPRPVAAWEAAPDCNPTDGHTPACRAREDLRTCSKAPNFVRLSDEIAWLRRELHAVRVLDAWVAKRCHYLWQIDRFRGDYAVRVLDSGEGCTFDYCKTPALARIAAAKALLEEDPNILEEPCKAG
jgi:hypothetical protein